MAQGMEAYGARRRRDSTTFGTTRSVGGMPSRSAGCSPVGHLILFSVYITALAALFVGQGGDLAQSGSMDCSRDLPPSNEDARFYPAGTFGPGTVGIDLAFMHSCHLRLMGEHPLDDYLSRGRAQVYRVMVWPAYRLPLIVRLEIRPDGTGEVAAKAEKSMWHPGTLSVDRTTEVSKPEVDKFLMLVEQADFWSIPTDEFFVENQRRTAEAAATGRRRALIKEMGGVPPKAMCPPAGARRRVAVRWANRPWLSRRESKSPASRAR